VASESKRLLGSPKAKALFGVIIVVVAAIVVVSLTTFQPRDEDASGAIGAAEKYRAEQISDEDVKLDETELQQLLQDDEILALLENEELMNAIAQADEALFEAIAAFGPEMALALKEEAAQTFEAIHNSSRKTLEPFLAADEATLRAFQKAGPVTAMVRNSDEEMFQAIYAAPNIAFEALKYGHPTVYQELKAHPNAAEALKAESMTAFKSVREAKQTNFDAMMSASPNTLIAIREASATTFKAMTDTKYETFKVLIEARSIMEAMNKTAPEMESFKAVQDANPASIEALKTLKRATFDAMKNAEPATFIPAQQEPPSVVDALRSANKDVFKAFSAMDWTTVEALRGQTNAIHASRSVKLENL
jgi:hypothetical protein